MKEILKIPEERKMAAMRKRKKERNLDSGDILLMSSICYLDEDSDGVEVQFWRNSRSLKSRFYETYLSGYQLDEDISYLNYLLFLQLITF